MLISPGFKPLSEREGPFNDDVGMIFVLFFRWGWTEKEGGLWLQKSVIIVIIIGLAVPELTGWPVDDKTLRNG